MITVNPPRRRRPSRTKTAVAVAVGAALVVAACGDDGGSDDDAGSSADTGAAPDATDADAPEVSDDFIVETFAGEGDLGGDLEIELGAALLLSTSQAVYGQESLKGIELAIDEIAAAGGPKFSINTKDLSVNTTAGADAVREWGEGGDIDMAVAAGFFGTGSMVPLLEEYEILTIDPGGGTSTAFQGLPYAFGGRAITPDDALGGVAAYLAEAHPDATRWAVTGYDLGELTAGTVALLEDLAAENGAEVVGQSLVPSPSQGTADYNKAIDELRGMDPDVIWNWSWGSDPAVFMKQYDLAGMDALVVGPDFSASTVELAGEAFDGYLFAYDYFDATNPRNPWGQHFVEAFRAEHGYDPDYYPANYYEDIYIFWETIKRTLAAGGDVTSGADLQEAFLSDPTFPSVYGEGDTTGEIAFDADTHTLSSRPMGMFVIEDGAPKRVASFNIGGAGFEPVS